MPKDKLIQIDLKLRATAPMVGAIEPLLRVPDRPDRKRNHRGHAAVQVGPKRSTRANAPNAYCRDALEAFQAVGVNRRSLCEVCLTNSMIVAFLKFRTTAIRIRPEMWPRSFNSHQQNGGLPPFQMTEAGLETSDPSVGDLHLAT